MNILLVCPFNPFPPLDGSSRRVNDIIRLYLDCGFSVHVLMPRQTKSARNSDVFGSEITRHYYPVSVLDVVRYHYPRLKAAMGKVLGVERLRNYPADIWCADALKTSVRSLVSSIQAHVVQVEYAYASRCLEELCGVVKVIDTHDVFSDRWRKFEKQGSSTLWYSLTRQDETKLLSRSDIALAISTSDMEDLRTLAANTKLVLLDYIQRPASEFLQNSSRREIVFLGSDNRMNREGLAWLVKSVLPLIRQDHPDFLLSVYGGVAKSCPRVDGLKLCGEALDLDELFGRACVLLNSVSVGTGLPMKNIDALSRGVPVICTPNAARGADKFIGHGIVIADSPFAFAEAVLSVIRNEFPMAHHSRGAVSIANTLYEEAKLTVVGLLGDVN